MKNINMLSPYSFHYLWKYEIGKQYICKLANELLNDNEEYVLLPFFNEKLNNVRSYVILESSSKILFIDFNFKKNDNLLKTDLLLMKYLKYTNKKAVKLIIINNYKGINNEIDNIIDIYNNDIKSINLKFMYAKKYKDQFIINKSITNLLYKMTKEEYKIYLHEKMLKERIERIINNKDVTLEEKRKYFNNWVIENNYFDDMDIVELQKFINAMATWYTLRYPSEVLENDNMPSTKMDRLSNQSEYLDFVLKGPINKRNMVLVRDDVDGNIILTMRLDENLGVSCVIENNTNLDSGILLNKDLKEVVDILRENNIVLYDEKTPFNIIEVIKEYEKQEYFKKGLLSAIMGEIISRDLKYGPIRGMKFAKEYNLDLREPLRYGISTNDDINRRLIKEYLEVSSNQDVVCYLDYLKYQYMGVLVSKIPQVNLRDVIRKYQEEDAFLEKEEVRNLAKSLKK